MGACGAPCAAGEVSRGVTSAARGEQRLARYVSRPSFAIEDRIERALKQRLYLLTADRHTDGPGASFAILGSTGNVYRVDFGLMPCCDCPDFMKGRGLCKHVLFIWLRVLRCAEDDPRIWQKALLSEELRAAVETLFSRKSRRLPSMADKIVRDAYAQATGSVGQNTRKGTDAAQDDGQRRRQALEGEDCSVCFEAMMPAEESSGLLTFCCSCGQNFHKDCIQRWQRASSGDCPLCRQLWVSPFKIVPPGAPLPQLQLGSTRSLRSRSCSSFGGGYLNLSNFAV